MRVVSLGRPDRDGRDPGTGRDAQRADEPNATLPAKFRDHVLHARVEDFYDEMDDEERIEFDDEHRLVRQRMKVGVVSSARCGCGWFAIRWPNPSLRDFERNET